MPLNQVPFKLEYITGIFDILGQTTSVLWKSLLYFIDKLSLYGIEKAFECFSTTSDGVNTHVFSPKEIQEYNR